MKKCLICGHLDESGKAATCPKCGEATWKVLEAPAPEPEIEPAPAPEAPKKRSRR